MADFIVRLNGTNVEEPRGFKDLNEEILRDDELRVITVSYNGSLEFFGNGYNLLEELYFTDYCSEVSIEVLKDGEKIIDAIINLSDAEWMINKRIVTVDLDQPVFQQRIFNNYDLKVYIASEKSISGEEITPTQVEEIAVRKPADSAIAWNDVRDGWVFKDALRWFIDYLTDGTADFDASALDEWDDDQQKLFIIPGANALYLNPLGKQLSPLTSFKEIWENAWRSFNLYMVIKGNSVEIVKEQDLYSSSELAVLDSPMELRRLIDLSRLYGRINAGGQKSIKKLDNTTADNAPFPYLFFRSFAEEEFLIGGTCGTDQTLDLTRTYIADVNKWQNLLDEVSTSYTRDEDENIYFVFCQIFTTYYRVFDYSYYDWNGGGAQERYNEPLLNEEIIKRFDLQGDVILNSGLLTINFLAFRSGTNVLSGTVSSVNPPVTLDSEDPVNATDVTAPGFPGSAYNAPSSTFTAPQNDIYTFEIEQFFEFNPGDLPTTASLVFDMGVEPNNVTGDRVEAQSYEYQILEINGTPIDDEPIEGQPEAAIFVSGLADTGRCRVRVKGFVSIYLEASDTATAYIDLRAQATIAAPGQVTVYDGSFANIGNGTAGGDYDVKDPNSYYIHILEFDNYLTDDQWETLKADPTLKIGVPDKDGSIRYGYVKTISRNIVKQSTEFSIIFNRNQKNF